MENNVPHEELIRRYLLNQLADDERQRFEMRLMTDDELYQQVLLSEDDLVDEYARDALPEGERKQFELSFLSSEEGRRQVEFARELRKLASQASARAAQESAVSPVGQAARRQSLFEFLRSQHRLMSLSFATAALLILAGGTWLAVSVYRLQYQLDLEQARNRELMEELQREQSERARLEQQLAASGSGDGGLRAGAVVALTLTPGATRDAGSIARISIPSAATVVQLHLNLRDDAYTSYSAEVGPVGGDGIWRADNLAQSSNRVVLSVPATMLPAGDYVVRLSGVTTGGGAAEVDRYYFRAARD